MAVSVTLPEGSFQVHARLFTATGQACDTIPVRIDTKQVSTAPWNIVQIGTPPPRRPVGAATNGADSIDLLGDGNCIAWQEVNGDVELIAHVAQRPSRDRSTQDDGTSPDESCIGGVLFRADLMAHDTFLGNRFVAAYSQVDLSTHLQCHKDHNGGGPIAGPDLGQFDWIKLQRRGSVFTASFSKDGQTWQGGDTRSVDMPAKIFAGIFIHSNPGYNQQVNSWRFDHVSIKALQ
jgi:hypothetical protein